MGELVLAERSYVASAKPIILRIYNVGKVKEGAPKARIIIFFVFACKSIPNYFCFVYKVVFGDCSIHMN